MANDLSLQRPNGTIFRFNILNFEFRKKTFEKPFVLYDTVAIYIGSNKKISLNALTLQGFDVRPDHNIS